MYPELFEVPFIHVTVKSYGLMMVIGFLAAVSVIRYLSRDITPNPQYITNAALYSLIAGVVGARLFYVFHHADQFHETLMSVFAIWHGGLELLGGVVLAIAVIFFYLCYHKLAIRRYLDILAIGLMLALVFGRIGCFLNGCCFGKPTDLPWAVRFPYGSFAYKSQIYPNLTRNRSEPQLKLPAEFCTYPTNENAILPQHLKAYAELTQEQKDMVDNGQYRCLPVHPTQLYSSATAAVLCLVLYFFWRRSRNAASSKAGPGLFINPGCTFALMFILYGIARFLMEFLRDDNPFEVDSLTISQLLGIALVVFGAALMAVFQMLKPEIVVLDKHNGIRERKQKRVTHTSRERR